ncbi:MAG: hypothetical protein MUF53_10000 [Gemmatimonadaceae bacterium]|nr:hypothetical protein [Gemmatimonadaceae bacterium]
MLYVLFRRNVASSALPGAVGGAIFGLVLLAAARRRRFDELSLPRYTALGAVGGVLLSLVPELLVLLGLATLDRPDVATLRFVVVKGVLLGGLGAASAAVTFAIARRAESSSPDRRPHDAAREPDAAVHSGDVRHLAASAPVATVRSRSATRSPGTP